MVRSIRYSRLAGAQRAGLASTAGKKHSLQIESSKTEAGDRVYRIQK